MPRNAAREESRRYHHGDLRNALIVAAAELIEESGSDDFAMVDAARRAGVSTAAPYRHFQDRDDLRLAVAELGFYGLNREVELVRDASEPGAIDTIVAMGQCYIRYVTEKPAFFSLMWGEQGHSMLDDAPDLDRDRRARGFYMLVDQVAIWCEQESVREPGALEISMTLWSVAMGLCHLQFNRQFERFAPSLSAYELLSHSGHSYLLGILAQQEAAYSQS